MIYYSYFHFCSDETLEESQAEKGKGKERKSTDSGNIKDFQNSTLGLISIFLLVE
jgi:hypothetical protein